MTHLDVVIVNWNAGDQLLDCLLSLQDACSGSKVQLSKCVIVDNASSDDSLERLDRLRFDPIMIRNQENKGFGFASNQGARMGASEYILFLNPDVRLFPDSLTKALLFMEDSRNQSVGILGIQLLDKNGMIQHNTARFPTPRALLYQMAGLDHVDPLHFLPYIMTDWDHRENRDVDQVQGAFFLVRRNTFEALSGFDQSFFMYYEDVDFAYRAKQAGWRSYYLADAQAFHRGGGTSDQVKAERLFYWLKSRAQYVAKHFGRAALVKIVIASVGMEFWARIAWNLINLSGRHLLETIQAYGMYVRALPQLLRKPRTKVC